MDQTTGKTAMSTWDPSGLSSTAMPVGIYTARGLQGPYLPGVFRIRQVAAPASYRELYSAESNNTDHHQPTCLSELSQQEKPRSYERQVLAAAASVTAALNKPKGSSTDFFKVN